MNLSVYSDEIKLLDSRKTVGFVLSKLHDSDDKIVAVYADVGSRFGIKGKLEDKEVEIGIAEQSLIPILGGMAHEGYTPFGIAYAPFITMRAADQIRMTIGQMGLNIILIGGSAGLVSGNLGAASLALDDIAMMRAIPNVTIMSPSDSMMEAFMLDEAANLKKPVYIRLTGNKLPNIYNDFDEFEIGKVIEVYNGGSDAVLFSTGAVTYNAIEAAKKLKKLDIGVTVVDVPYLKPLGINAISEYIDYPLAFTIEEHNIIGGLYGAICELISEGYKQKVIPIGVKDSYLYPDSYERLLSAAGLDIEGIAERIYSEITEFRKI